MTDIRKSVIIAIILTVACLVLSCVIFFSYHAIYHYQVIDVSQVSRYPGDINADFKITWDDVSAIQKLYQNQASYTQLDLECADLTGDGVIDNEDTALLLLYLSEHDTWTLRGLENYCRQNRGSQG